MPLAVFVLRINHLSDEMIFGLLDFVSVELDVHGGTHLVTFQKTFCKGDVTAICF